MANPANPEAYRAGKGLYVEFDVPRTTVFPAGKPEWGVIPGPNVGTTRFGPIPSEMPRASCILVVCSR
ncbi:TreTu family toxin [Tessaracoccus terricola]